MFEHEGIIGLSVDRFESVLSEVLDLDSEPRMLQNPVDRLNGTP